MAAVLTSGLVAAGHRVVTHLSPHVDDIRERFVIDGALAEWPVVAEAVAEVRAAVERTDGSPRPTFFAVTAATAAVLGRLVGADWLVVEAGIGGRVDATNVFTRPDVLTVITPIGLDHTDVLGSTPAAVASEKAAVVAGRADVVLAPQPHPEAAEAVQIAAATHGVAVHAVTGDPRDWVEVAVATARRALQVLGIDQTAVDGPSPNLPGRFEQLEVAGRHVILDGAHNPMKLAALGDLLRRSGRAPVEVVAAVGAGKDLDGCARELKGIAPRVVATTFEQPAGVVGPRGWPSAKLAAALRGVGAAEVDTYDSLAAAVTDAVTKNEPGDVIVVTGSFLHLAAAREVLQGLAAQGQAR